jgi:hypothetical protein
MTMKNEENKLLEELADLEHQQWKHLMEYFFSLSINDMRKKWKEWEYLSYTCYAKLNEEDKEKDRIWARKVLELLKSTNECQISSQKGCGELIYNNDKIRCGDWSGGDQHFCIECFNAQNKQKEAQK